MKSNLAELHASLSGKRPSTRIATPWLVTISFAVAIDMIISLLWIQFTDPTSYQALFYFLVIKPAITLILTILVWAAAFPLLLLILPAPAVLRAVRRLGKWQANIAIEGLYLAVR